MESQIKVDILDYLGKVDDGIIVLISLSYQDEFYEGTFYYKKNIIALTPDEKLEEKLGTIIEEWEGYNDLVLDIIKKIVPYDDMIKRIDDLDLSQYGIDIDENNLD